MFTASVKEFLVNPLAIEFDSYDLWDFFRAKGKIAYLLYLSLPYAYKYRVAHIVFEQNNVAYILNNLKNDYLYLPLNNIKPQLEHYSVPYVLRVAKIIKCISLTCACLGITNTKDFMQWLADLGKVARNKPFSFEEFCAQDEATLKAALSDESLMPLCLRLEVPPTLSLLNNWKFCSTLEEVPTTSNFHYNSPIP